MTIHFEWDENKDNANIRKHRIGFEAASEALEDLYRIVEEDSVVDGEQRLRTICMAANNVVLLVIHLEVTDNNDSVVRIISARKATPQERRRYDQARAENAGNTP